jgi:hypothetical protein
VLALDVEDLDLPNRRARVRRKGGATDWIVWQTGTARLLPRLLNGRKTGSVFLTDRRARVQLPPGDIDPASGRARLSYSHAEALFKEASGGATLHHVGAGNYVTSCDLGVFVDQAAEAVPAQNAYTACFGRWMCAPCGRVLLQRLVRPMAVVMIGVLAEDQPQVPLAGDQHPVQALAAGAGNPPFGDRVRTRRLDGRLDDPHPGRGEYRVEGGGELGVPVPDEEFEAVRVITEVHQQVAGLLGHPLTRGVGGDPGQVHASGAVLDEEQHSVECSCVAVHRIPVT